MVTWRDDVVVGVDGSEAGMHALEWAAAAAGRRGAPLTVLCAYDLAVGLGTVVNYGPDALRTEADDVLRRARKRLGQVSGERGAPSRVRYEATRGAAATVLVQRSRTAALVVVGRRGLGRFDRVLMGSVSSSVAAMGHGPVAVVPLGAGSRAPRRVVAGVDPDDQPGRVLAEAFEEARWAGAPLTVVHVVDPGVLGGVIGTDPAWLARFHDEAAQALHDEAVRWAEKYPGVTWSAQVRTGPADRILLGLLRSDDVAVVGGRRHGTLVGRVLGSVSDRVLRRAPCPVVIAHDA